MKKLLNALFCVGSLLMAASAADTVETKIDDHAASFLPAGKKWKLAWRDEFDGTELDRTKWGFRLNFWGKRFPAYSEEGVEVKAGTLRLNIVKLPDGNFCSPHLQTGSLSYDIPKDTPPSKFWPFGKMEKPRFMHRFGYYEIRCRMPKNDGWHCAFWLQAPGVGSHPDPRFCGVEVDVMENYSLYNKNKIVGGPIWGGYGRDNRRSGHFQWEHHETPDKWHYYGVEWSPDGYKFYIDGKFVGATTPDKSKVAPVLDKDGKPCGGTLYGPVSWVDQFILVSTEVHDYRKAMKPDPALVNAKLPDFFEVDFVRVYDDENLDATGITPRYRDDNAKDGNFDVF